MSSFRLFLPTITAPQAANSRTVSVELSPRRGTIYDRNGKVLASDVQATTIYCNPKEITDVKSTAEKLAGVLGGDASIYEGALSTENTTFAYVKRKVDQDKGEEVQGLGLDGISFLDDMKRVHPSGSIAGQLLGLVDVDGNGQTGLELYYDSILKGEPGELVAAAGAACGHVLSQAAPKLTSPPKMAKTSFFLSISTCSNMSKSALRRV